MKKTDRNHIQHRNGVTASLEGRSETVRRAFDEFLALPTTIIAVFVLLAVGLHLLEYNAPTWLQPLRVTLQSHFFGTTQATADLLGTIAGSLITVATVTITLLLLALQQNAASLSTEVFDQFLRRRLNQFYFSFFIGLALYALVILTTVNEPFNPVLAATLAVLLTVVALYILIVLLYTVINQMRPAEIMQTLHEYTLHARQRQQHLLARTRRQPHMTHPVVAVPAPALRHGYVTRIDLDAIEQHFGTTAAEVEVVLHVSVGSFVSYGDVLAHISAGRREDGEALADVVCGAIRLERQRDIAADPGDGIEELGTIAWTSISTSKSNPAPGIDAIRILRDLLARWSEEQQASPDESTRTARVLPVVYRDTVWSELMDHFESLAVVSSESMQHQAFSEIVRTFAVLYDRVPVDQRPRMEDVIRRILSALGDHVLTADLDQTLAELSRVLAAAGRNDVSAAVETARARLAQSVGQLNSRSSRVASKN